jgi:hypothetical protein
MLTMSSIGIFSRRLQRPKPVFKDNWAITVEDINWDEHTICFTREKMKTRGTKGANSQQRWLHG